MKHITMERGPLGSDGRMFIALSGYQDMGISGITFLEELQRQWDMEQLGSIDTDPFFMYGPQCPWSHRHEDGTIQVHWPRMEMHQRRNARGPLIVTGWQPNLRLQEFGRVLVELARIVRATDVIQFGSRGYAVPHTIDPPVTGMASNDRLHGMMSGSGMAMELGGEDPAILDACRRNGLGYASLCAHLPGYLQITPNWSGAEALARQAALMMGIDIDMELFSQESGKFREKLDRITRNNPGLAKIVAGLEEQAGVEHQRQEVMEIDPKEMTMEVEEFLRQQREQG